MIRNFFKKILAGTFLAGSFFGSQIQAAELPSPSHPLIVIMLGPPGSGKGTQAAMLRETLNIPHISTGDLLRDQIQQQSELGKKAKLFMEKGQLVPDALIIDMLFDRVSQKDCAGGYILDGFPRTLAQAESYHSRLKNPSKVVAINLQIADQKIIERITQRIVCASCGTPYNLVSSPPAKAGICDKCHSPLKQRSDDTQEIMQQRLQVYHQQTSPLIDFYSKQNKIHHIDCEKSKEDIFSTILSSIFPKKTKSDK